MAYGAGDWVLDFALTEPKPAPVTTIAWWLGHLCTGFSLRWEWSFGARKKLWDTIQFTPSAEGHRRHLKGVAAAGFRARPPPRLRRVLPDCAGERRSVGQQ